LPPGAAPRRLEVAYYTRDECILVDGEYLIRSLPAKIFWKLLRSHASGARAELTHRELRLDKPLNRLAPRGRGRFALELRCDVALVDKP